MEMPFAKDINELKKNQKALRIIELIANVVILLVVLAIVIRPTVVDILALRADKQEVEALAGKLSEKVTNLASAETAVDEFKSSVPLFTAALPLEPKQFDLLNQAQLVAEEQGLSVDQLTYKAGDSSIVEFTIVGKGKYGQIVFFINSLEEMPRLVQLKEVSIAQASEDLEENPTLTYTITGKGYYYTEEVSLISDPSEN
ncbi:type 4a pilus biogenesis protein PilO [candidate division WWE3 bacterium]|uniref:Type 4a pilus biogenesis protein PilO n=1 Tax=candidate division WWE3 bacterium TaxID=2053526 RepID=A0A955RPT8_UNCKA|nr:type 4a pilus biogenesis protein PilO [candidate division WWE3 bacterium]